MISLIIKYKTQYNKTKLPVVLLGEQLRVGSETNESKKNCVHEKTEERWHSEFLVFFFWILKCNPQQHDK